MGEAQSALEREDYINLETFKRDGSGVLTPIWFVAEGDDWVFFTDGNSWKVKRLGRNDRVRFAACNARGKVHGAWFEGRCRPVEDPAEMARTREALTKKYGWKMHVARAASFLAGRSRRARYYRIWQPQAG